MSDILPTVWPAEEHTLAKHAILKRYVEAWFPILSRQARVTGRNQRILYIDGFAGPGEYREGEPGSPVIALRAALEHSHSFPVPVRLLFIEQREDRYQHLLNTLERFRDDLTRSRNVDLRKPLLGDCDEILSNRLARYEEKGLGFGPALAFLDQFGYSAVSLELVAKIMQYPQCEVFSYLDFRDMNRWITDPMKAVAFTRAYGGEEWREAISLPSARRQAFLLEKYKSALRDRAGVKYVQSFAMLDKNGVLIYWLLFCTNSLRGLEEMKKAMWAVDDSGAFRFSDKDDPDQMKLLDQRFSQDWLAEKLELALPDSELTVGDVKAFVLENTPCYLFKGALTSLYRRRRLMVPNPPQGWRKGTFPNDEMIVRFSSKPLF